MYNKKWQQTYRNLPYKSGGRDIDGVDCYGLAHLIYKEELNINLPTYEEDYKDANNIKQTAGVIQANMDISWDTVEEPQPFDVVVIRIGEYPCHIGIVYKKGWMIHCLAGSSVTCERYDTNVWEKRIVGFRRYNEESLNLPVLSEGININTKPNPFSAETISYVALEGTSVLDIILGTNSFCNKGHVYIEGKYIPEYLWETTFPLSGDRVMFVSSIPEGGGGGKDLLRIVAMVAVIAVAGAYGPAFASSMGLGTSTFVGGLGTAVIGMAGYLAVNALIPPTIPERLNSDQYDSPSYTISSTYNSLKPWDSIPVILGTVYNYAPPLASKTWTEIDGDDSYYHMLVVWGYGPLLISDIKIEETSIYDFDDVEINTIGSYTPGEAITGWSNTVHEESLSILLEEANGYSTRTILDTDEIDIILTFPSLVTLTNTGKKTDRTVNVEVGYREVGTTTWYGSTVNGVEIPANSWITPRIREAYAETVMYILLTVDGRGRLSFRPGSYYIIDAPYTHIGLWRIAVQNGKVINTVDLRDSGVTGLALTITEGTEYVPETIDITAGTVDLPTFSTTAAQTTAVRKTFPTILPSKGDYEIRVRRVTLDSDDDNIIDKVYWAGVQNIVYTTPIQGPPDVTLAVTALRIRANEQLSGSIDQLNGTVSSVVATAYNTTSNAWETGDEGPAGMPGVVSSQPGDLIRHILQSDVMAKSQPDTKLDLTSFEEFIEYTTDQGFSYNNVLESQIDAMSLIREIAAAGRAMPRLVDGKWSFVIDRERDEYAQTFVAENIWNLSISKTLDVAAPHAWRVIFRNELEEGAIDERIVYDDGYTITNATDIQILELPGVTNPDAVWKQARYHIAVARLRPRLFEFYADMEHMVAQRGDLIELNHPTPLIGTGSGRVKSVTVDGSSNTTGVVLTDQVQMESGKTYGALFRTNNTETRLTVSVNTVAGDTDTLTFSSVIASGNPAPSIDDICAFGETGKITSDLLIKNIYPIESGDRYSAVIEAVDYSPAIFTSSSGTIPDFDPNVTEPINPGTATPATPVITQVLSNEYAMALAPDGSKQPRILVEFTAGQGGTTQTNGFILQYMLSSGTSWKSMPAMPKDSTNMYISNVDDNTYYDVRLSATSDNGNRSGWATEDDVYVSISNPPSDVTDFSATWNSIKRTVDFTWTEVVDIDLSYYEIREGSDWATTSGTVITSIGNNTTLSIEEGTNETKTYLIKAVDNSGLYSVNADSDTAAVATSDCLLATPTGLSLTTTSTISYDGTERTLIIASWDDNAEVSSVFRQYNIRIIKVVDDYITTYATTETEFTFTAIANLDYSVQVRAVDMTGNATAWTAVETITAAKDETPPATPDWSTTSVVPGFKMIGLRWTSNTEKDLATYDLERSTTGAFTGEEVSLGVKAGSFTTDNDLAVDTTYYYRMRAVDTSENASDWGPTVSGTTLQVGTEDIAYNCIVSNHIQTLDLTALDAKITGTLTASNLVITDINALNLLNGPAAAGADVTGDNTANDTTHINGIASSTVIQNIVYALSTANTAQSTADGKVTTFYQISAPTAETTGDLWFDTNDGNKIYRWSGSAWIVSQDTEIATAISAASGAQATADGKVTTFYQTGTPTAEGTGDLWVDTNDDNKLYRWSGSSWVSVRDVGIGQALSDSADALADAATAQSTADGKIVSFYQATAPAGASEGDLWFDTDDGNKIYRYSGSSWVVSQDTEIADAISASAGAQATADGKVTTFYQTGTPTAEGTGDLWVDTDDDNLLYRWSGSAWQSVRDGGITQAVSDAADAIADAATAQSTADGKVTTFYQTGTPTAEGVGDLWIDTDDGNKLYRWSGSAWVVVQDEGIASALSDAATAQSTADGKIVSFYQATAPAGASEGDLWFDTDDDNTPYWYSGSAWQSVYNPTLWADVGDPTGTKPENNADVTSDHAGNLVDDPNFEAAGTGWAFDTGWSVSTGEVFSGTYAAVNDSTFGNATNNVIFSTSDGERFLFQCRAKRDVSADGLGGVRIIWLSSTGTIISFSYVVGVLISEFNTNWTWHREVVVAPTNTTNGVVELIRGTSTTGNIYIDNVGVFSVTKNSDIDALYTTNGPITANADNTATSTFVTTTYPSDISNLEGLIDGKIDTWYTSTDPSGSWSGTDSSHEGDMWWNTSTKQLKRYSGSAWSSALEDQKAIDAYNNAADAQDTADGKRRVFTSTPTAPYDVGDLWATGLTPGLWVCNTAAITGASFSITHWEAAADITLQNKAKEMIYFPQVPTGTAGFFNNGSYMGFHDGTNWKNYFKNDGKFYFSGDSDNYFQWNGTTLTLATDGTFYIKGGGDLIVQNTGDITIESGGGLTIEDGGDILLEDGGDITLVGADTDPAQLILKDGDNGSSTAFYSSYDGDACFVTPSTDATIVFSIGTATSGPNSGNDFKYIAMGSTDGVYMTHDYSSTLKTLWWKSNALYPVDDADLGNYSIPWKDLYMSKRIFFEGNSDQTHVSDHAILFGYEPSSTTELRAKDSAGNANTITPHNFSLFTPDQSYESPWSYYSENPYLGKKINVDMYGAIKAIEELSGKKFIYIEDMPEEDIRDWDDDQAQIIQEREDEIEKWEGNKEKLKGNKPNTKKYRELPDYMKNIIDRRKNKESELK